MGATAASRILLCAENAAAVDDMRRLLEQHGHTTDWHDLDGEDACELAACDLVVLDSSQREQEALELCQRLRTRLAERMLPILLLAECVPVRSVIAYPSTTRRSQDRWFMAGSPERRSGVRALHAQ